MRVDLEGYWYHVIARGNAKQKIFRETGDYRYYLSLLDKALVNKGGHIGCFCLMPNHVHLLIYRGKRELSEIIHWVHSKYSHVFNTRYKRVGHLFQGRYRSLMVLNETYLRNLLIYVHNNPRRANLVKKNRTYLWSSEQYYLGKQIQYDSFKFVPGFEGRDRITEYKAMSKTTSELTIPIYKSFIGTDSDAKRISRRKAGRTSKFRYERREKNTMFEIAATVAKTWGVSVEELKSKSRRRKISSVRKRIIKMMVGSGYGASEISRFFGRVPSYVVEVAHAITE